MLATDLHVSSIARLSPRERKKLLAQLTDDEADDLLHDWRFWARTEQVAPPGDWLVWLYLAGRGAGKTRSGAEWCRELVKQGYGHLGLIAPTAADARDVMVEGISGIQAVCWVGDRSIDGSELGRPIYEPSKRRLTWANGAQATLFSAEESDRLRGPQHDALWLDELAAWQEPEAAWDMAMFGLRLGHRPRAMVTTTPRPIPIVREIVKSPHSVVTRGTTWDNRAHLAQGFFDQIVAKYEGTRLGRQELSGEILEDVEGALWKRGDIHYRDKAPELVRIVVSIDPPASSTGESALAGVVAAGIDAQGYGYVLADRSGRKTPKEWAHTAVVLYDEVDADRIVAEANQGGEMVSHTIDSVRPNLPVSLVHASRAKQARAEPVAALYEQGRVFHVGAHPDLEDQMCTWEPLTGAPSPDRLDALVWALTDLMVGQGAPVYPAEEKAVVVDPLRIPSHWPRVAAIDCDRLRFVCLWGAWDRANDVVYLTEEYVAPMGAIPVHAEAIRKRVGPWVPALFELEARGRSKDEGVRIGERFIDLSVLLYECPLDEEGGVADVTARLNSARLKVFSTCREWITEFRRYRRDPKKDELVEDGNHLMRATQMIASHGLKVAVTENQARSDADEPDWGAATRNRVTGY